MDLNVDYRAGANWDEKMLERLRYLRDNEPVFWSEESKLWVVTNFQYVSYVSKHQEIFTSGLGVRPDNDYKLGLIDEEEPRHGNLRKLINRGFTPRMVKNLEKIFLEIVTETIDKVASRAECDFVDDIAVPMPLLLIAEMIGIRREDRERFHQWSDAMIGAEGHLDNPVIAQRAALAFAEYAAYVTEIIEDRRKSPREDLVSILVGAKDEGLLVEYDQGSPLEAATEDDVELANDELIKLLVLLLVAGNETTRNGISGGMQMLIENPGERQKLLDDPALIPAAVEEMLRIVSPVRTFSRTAVQDSELGGKPIRKDDKVLIIYPSANTDPAEFEDPETFNIERNPHHLSFGIGNHFCMGANLARMEMCVAFRELLRRLPDMEYSAGGPEFQPSPLVRTCSRMLVRYTPEG